MEIVSAGNSVLCHQYWHPIFKRDASWGHLEIQKPWRLAVGLWGAEEIQVFWSWTEQQGVHMLIHG